jgi:outer membrane protein OmpA-like peptidoglycan-associated protein
MPRFLAILFFLVLAGALNAQSGQKVPSAALGKLKKVREALTSLKIDEARTLSGKLVRQYPDWPEGWMVHAEVCQEAGDAALCEQALRKVVALDMTGYPEAYRWLAERSFKRGDYEDASAGMQRYLALIRNPANLPFAVKRLNASISFAIDQLKNPSGIVPDKLAGSVNSPDDEYFPSLSIDGSLLVFTRQTKNQDPNIKKPPQEDLFFVTFRDSGYQIPEAFPFPINSKGNEGTQSLRQDGRIMFFTACNRPDTKGGCDIYYCVKTGDSWSDPINPGNPLNSRYWESTPFLAQDGTRLLFASNRPGGFGGMDIWQSVLKPDRSWSAPVNLGSRINTQLDELSPLLLVDGKTLFFASNGHVGMGGFDLLKTDLAGTGEPQNLGYPFNTWSDDHGLTVNMELNLGVFGSGRDSTTGMDLYQVDMSPFIPVKTVMTLSGTVRDKITGLPVGARVEVQPFGDSLISRVEADPVTGRYLLGIAEKPAYRIGFSNPGYMPYSLYYQNDNQSEKRTIEHLIELEPIKTGAAIVLQNIFFALNSSELLPESDKDLEEILNLFRQNPGIVIELSGHTDNTGTDAINRTLSQKRAESVMNYLIAKGIKPEQLTAKGYGSSNPVASNDTEDGRRLNRRTEMKVIRMK